MVKNLRLLFLTLLCAVFNASMAYETVTVPYEEELINSQGQFEIENVSLGGLEAIWKTSKYGMTANGYKCTGDVESWFISPLIDASSVTSLFLTFDQNVTYFTSTEVALEEATLWVREGSNGNWTKLTIPNFENVSNNNFSNAGNIDLSAYAGKTIQLGFKYTATATKPGRWEIKNLKVTGEASQPPVEKKDPELSYEPNGNIIVYLNEENTFPVLQNPNNLPVTYSSNNEAVATINADGEVTLVGVEGNATIKANFEGNDTYEAGSAQYTLVVKERGVAGTDVFELVTSASDLADGDAIIIVNGDKDYALSTNQKDNNRAGESVTDEGDKITPDSKVQVITLEGSASAWNFNVGNGYLYAPGDGNYLRTEDEVDADGKANATIEISDGIATITFQIDADQSNLLRYNPNNGNPIFSCYKSTSSIKNPVRIYKKPSTPSTQKPAELAYSAEEFEWTIGVSMASELPTLSNPNKLTVTYESTNTEVATVDATGKVTVKEVVGETTIKAHSAETSDFKEGNASYTLKVVKPFVAKTYELVTSAKTLKAGDNIIIVSPTNDYAMSTEQVATSKANYRGITEAKLAENYTITSTVAMADIVLGGKEGAWTFQVTNGDAMGYLYAVGGGNFLGTAEALPEAGGEATIEINDKGNADIKFNTAEEEERNYLGYNKSASRFSCYKGTSGTVSEVRIYREAREYEEVEITSAGYATMYYGQKTLKVPSGVTAYTYKATTEGLAISKTYNAKDVIPAGLAVVIKGAEGVYKFEKATNGTADANNMLMGFDDLAETVGPDDGNYLFYALSQNGKDEVGFYFMAEEGAAFKSGPHKAYLAVPADVAAAFYQFDGSSDGINNISREINANDEIYTISGVRVSGQLQKGIYIVNGKKVVVK